MKLKTHFGIGIGITASISITSLFAMLPLRAKGDTSRGNEWMKGVDGATPITALSIPGSHDAGAFYSIGDLSGKCQDLSIEEQLNAGARFFDIRLQQRSNTLHVVHGFVDQKLSFHKVLSSFVKFLEEHNSEALIVSVKKEQEDYHSNISFDDSLKAALSPYKSIWDTSGTLPRCLEKARGKIFLISRYDNPTIGLEAFRGWEDPKEAETNNTFDIDSSNLHVQDHYKIKDIEVKKAEFNQCLEFSRNSTNRLTLNFSSCYYVNSFPPSYAGTSAKIMNPWLIEQAKIHTNLGIIVSDFVTSSLCEAIYKRNFS